MALPRHFSRGHHALLHHHGAIGIVAFGLAWAAHSLWLKILAVAAGFSPLLIVWAIYAVLMVVNLVSGGRYPGPEWL